jgi:flagellin
MASINTNVAALTALRALTSTNSALDKTQNRVSTGLRVGTAADNAAYWSIATTMRSDFSSLSTVQDALGLGSATVDVAYTALDKVKDTLVLVRDKLTAAAQPGLPRDKIQTEITEMLGSLKGIADAATLQGQNWLSVDSSATGYSSDKSVVASISRAGGTLSLQTIAIDTSSMVLYDSGAAVGQVGILDSYRNGATGAQYATQPATPAAAAAGPPYVPADFRISAIDISGLTDSTNDMAILDGYIKGVDAAIGQLTAGATTLGAAQARIDIQQSFVTSLKDALEGGISQLVDADMNEESTRLQALQVKQQLGIQALSIANSSGQSILRLFQ